MHNYAQLCIMHFEEDTKGLQTRGILGLLTLFGSRRDTRFLIFRRWKNFIVLQSIFGSGNMCKCILVDKIVYDKHNNKLHWTRVKQNITHDCARSCKSAKLCIMHNYAHA